MERSIVSAILLVVGLASCSAQPAFAQACVSVQRDDRYPQTVSKCPASAARPSAHRHAAVDANANAARPNILRAYEAAGAASASRGCLTAGTRGILEEAERHFSVRFPLASTCRPGAVIASSGDPSWHRFGKAVDLKVPRGISKSAVVAWLYGHASGVTMTYRNMSHVHFDTGTYHKLVRGADAYGGSRHARRHDRRHASR